ncbi:MAG: hypothetical protein EBX49_09860 [Synechococcaceae bacterium WB8_1B_136]|nr:hypothetical protein [Synechococcaceae bacterium WB8_1B_136]
MLAGSRQWLASLIGVVLGAWLMLGAAPAPLLAAMPAALPSPSVPLTLSLAVDNVYGFSSRDKTYSVEGTLRVTAPAAEMQRWLAAGLEPVSLVRFQNQVQPWNSQLEPISGPMRQGDSLRRDYRFNGSFYSDEIDFRGYPFGALPLRLNLVADPSFPAAITNPPAIRLVAQSQGSGVSRRSNMNGYKLIRWRLFNQAGGVEMELVYQPIGWAALVKWLLPLLITMVVMLLTPNLRAGFSSERLAIPPVILLTLVFMQQAYRDSLPALPYLTVLDGLFAYSYLVTLAFFCEFIWCANLNDRLDPATAAGNVRRIERLELVMQLASLSGYGTLLGWAWSQR